MRIFKNPIVSAFLSFKNQPLKKNNLILETRSELELNGFQSDQDNIISKILRFLEDSFFDYRFNRSSFFLLFLCFCLFFFSFFWGIWSNMYQNDDWKFNFKRILLIWKLSQKNTHRKKKKKKWSKKKAESLFN